MKQKMQETLINHILLYHSAPKTNIYWETPVAPSPSPTASPNSQRRNRSFANFFQKSYFGLCFHIFYIDHIGHILSKTEGLSNASLLLLFVLIWHEPHISWKPSTLSRIYELENVEPIRSHTRPTKTRRVNCWLQVGATRPCLPRPDIQEWLLSINIFDCFISEVF